MYSSSSSNRGSWVKHTLPDVLPLSILHEKYEKKEISVTEVMEEVMQRVNKDKASWIFKVPKQHIIARAEALDEKLNKQTTEEVLQKYPLFGIPFSIKDNIDAEGIPTTAACPEYSYTSWSSNPVVEKLISAGAVLIGKNNMDQFAAGLVGVRSPYGIPENPFNKEYCPGGSSSGSGVVVSTGQVSFSLGTDTAGSGRVPASFTNTVGLKPTKGLLSTRGVVPACRSLDCISIFALTCHDAWKILQLGKGFDVEDEYSRREPLSPPPRLGSNPSSIRFAIPSPADLKFYTEKEENGENYQRAISILRDLPLIGEGGKNEIVEIDFRSFTSVAKLLYDGPWVAERLAAIEKFYDRNPDALHPITRSIIAKGKNYTSVDTFNAVHRLEMFKKIAYKEWEEKGVDVLVVPTASITPSIEEVKQVPVGINNVLGYYTNFVNLLDMCAIALPSDFLSPIKMPTGITLIAPAFHDELLYHIAAKFQSKRDLKLGASHSLSFSSLPSPHLPKHIGGSSSSSSSGGAHHHHHTAISKVKEEEEKWVEIAVVGAHLTGFPLNSRLTSLGGTLVRSAKTANHYELYDITKDGDKVRRPGLIKLPNGSTSDHGGIEVEVWKIPSKHVGEFLSTNVSSPLGIGSVDLDDHSSVLGFVCEQFASVGAKNISHFNGWRNYISSLSSSPSN